MSGSTWSGFNWPCSDDGSPVCLWRARCAATCTPGSEVAGRENRLPEREPLRSGPTLFYASSYGYRPGRRTQDAIAEAVHFGNNHYEWIVEVDVEACFDEIDHRALVSELERRIGNRRVLGLVRAFLKAGVMTEAGRFERRLTGTPQGGIISPLLANVALNVLDQEFNARWPKTQGQGNWQRRKGFATCGSSPMRTTSWSWSKAPKRKRRRLWPSCRHSCDRSG
jgi:hypothetical protein